MPHLSESVDPPPRSRIFWNSKTDGPPQPGQFTKSKQSAGGNTRSEEGDRPDPGVSEPFPPGLFRLPVPDLVFENMPDMSDAALRCTLALIHLSWRFDPKEGRWINAGEARSRREVQDVCGLSDEGTRQGLSELEERRWASVDRSGRSYQYKLRLDVPDARYTYLPTTLLEDAREFDSTTALRVLLAIFHGTWGWAQEETGEEEPSRIVHRRWARLSTSDLARRTGRSETAVKKAVGTLAGETIRRARPDRGAHLYRIRPEPFGAEAMEDPPDEEGPSSGENAVNEPPSNRAIANDLPPDRQRTGPPTSFREKGKRDKHSQKQKKPPKNTETAPSDAEKNAMPGNSFSENRSPRAQQPGTGREEAKKQDIALEDLPPKKQSLAQKLINAGVWPERAWECLDRYSRQRIEANFELYRKRAPEIEDDGAWLCAAITDGYADLQEDPQLSGSQQDDYRENDPQQNGSRQTAPHASRRSPPGEPSHKQKVSAEEKQVFVRRCPNVDDSHFHRYRSANGPKEKQFLYLDPALGGPTRRGASRQAPA